LAGQYRGRVDKSELASVVDRLHRQFGDAVTEDELEQVVVDTTRSFDKARIRAFVPLLVERIASDRLRGRGRLAS
jgi:hypothetical protein